MADNQRYYDVFVKAADDAVNKSWEDQDAPAKAGIDAVVAAVREDLMTGPSYDQICEWRRQEGRRHAARDIRAAGETTSWSREEAEHAARIAEGNTDRG